MAIVRFNIPDCIGDHERRWKLQQQMNMVLHPADGMDENALMLANAAVYAHRRPSFVLG